VRKYVNPDILSCTVPWKLFKEMEAHVEGSFLDMDQWLELMERRGTAKPERLTQHSKKNDSTVKSVLT